MLICLIDRVSYHTFCFQTGSFMFFYYYFPIYCSIRVNCGFFNLQGMHTTENFQGERRFFFSFMFIHYYLSWDIDLPILNKQKWHQIIASISFQVYLYFQLQRKGPSMQPLGPPLSNFLCFLYHHYDINLWTGQGGQGCVSLVKVSLCRACRPIHSTWGYLKRIQ